MYRNPDPKPGRWVLPIVVLGMVAFTWFFVQRFTSDEIPEDTPPSSTTTTVADAATVVATTSDPGNGPVAEPSTTTTTLLSAELQTYLDNLTQDQATLAELVVDMDRANADWDNRSESGVTYSETESAMEELEARALVFSQTVDLRSPPASVSGLSEAHQFAQQSSLQIAAAASEVLQGLRAPDTGELRRTALLKFRAEAEGFDLAADDIRNIILQGTG